MSREKKAGDVDFPKRGMAAADYWLLIDEVAKIISPEWFGGVYGDQHPLNNYPKQHLSYQQRAREKAIKIIDLVVNR